jgi:hypothetical protein
MRLLQAKLHRKVILRATFKATMGEPGFRILFNLASGLAWPTEKKDPAMTSIARRLCLVIVITFFANGASRADSGSIALVADLYKTFLWQAVVSPPTHRMAEATFGAPLQQQSLRVLEKYFVIKLAHQLHEDAACAKRTHELCQLSFDPIFASQDPVVADLTITAQGPELVSVEYRPPPGDRIVRLEFQMSFERGQWRIANISYPTLGPTSLRAVLTPSAGAH